MIGSGNHFGRRPGSGHQERSFKPSLCAFWVRFPGRSPQDSEFYRLTMDFCIVIHISTKDKTMTKKSFTITVETKKPRNEFVAAMRSRKSGAHGKTKKARRRSDKIAFAKQNHGDY